MGKRKDLIVDVDLGDGADKDKDKSDGGSAEKIQVIVVGGQHLITKTDTVFPNYHEAIQNAVDRLHRIEIMAVEAKQFPVALQCVALEAKLFGLTSPRAESWMLKKMTNAPTLTNSSPRLPDYVTERLAKLAKEHAVEVLSWAKQLALHCFEQYDKSLRAYNDARACYPIDGIIESWYWNRTVENASRYFDEETKSSILDAIIDEVFRLQFTRFINEGWCVSDQLGEQHAAFIDASEGAWNEDDTLSEVDVELFTNVLKNRAKPPELKPQKPSKKKP